MSTRGRLTRGLGIVDLKAATEGPWIDMMANNVGGMVAGITDVNFTGGVAPSVSVGLEMSPDKVEVYEVNAIGATWTNVTEGESRSKSFAERYFRYVRFKWDVNGGPSVATCKLRMEA